MKIAFFIFLLSLFSANFVFGQKSSGKVKFYNFDDLLIEGVYKKPQVLYTDARQKVKFERLLKLKKDFMPKLQATKRDPALK